MTATDELEATGETATASHPGEAESATANTEAAFRSLLANTAHRPYALPDGPPVMRQRWNDLLFAHWPIAPALMAAKIPAGLELDTFDGQAWLGVVPFRMDRVQHRVPLTRRAYLGVPTVSRFSELNLRTYVRSPRTGKRGVLFFALDCSSPLAVAGARVLFHLPYFFARMQVSGADVGGDGLRYRSRRWFSRRPVEVDCSYRATGERIAAPAGSLDDFLTSRYCLFTTTRGKVLCGDIHHGPWPLERAEVEFRRNDLPAAHGFRLPDRKPVLHLARALPVALWGLHEDR